MDKLTSLTSFASDPNLLSSYLKWRASELGISLPITEKSIEAIPWINVLLKLKPPDWSLKEFSKYMEFVFECFTKELTPDNLLEIGFLQIFENRVIYFHLDESLFSADLAYLFGSVLSIPLARPFLPENSGSSLIQGKCLENFNTTQYNQVVAFLQSMQGSFKTHVNILVLLYRQIIASELCTFFEIPPTTPRDAIADLCVKIVLPNIDLQTAEGKARSGSDLPFQLAYEQPLLSYDLIAHSFINHIKNIINVSNREFYFASYTFLGQSSSVGKSRLLQSTLISGDTGLFILYINCKSQQMAGIPKVNSLSKSIAERLMACRTENEVSIILRNLLYSTFDKVLVKEGSQYFLKDPIRSYEPQDIGLDPDVIFDGTIREDNRAIWGQVGEMVMNMQGRRNRDSATLLKVIPVVAFDEAGCFIDNVFDFMGIKSGMNTFRLIRRALRTCSDFIWECPFVFAGTNTRFGNFVPSTSKDSSARLDFASAEDSTSTSLLLFDPYVLTATWNVFAEKRNYSGDLAPDWLQYIYSNDYLYHLCNYGRPVWGAVVQGALRAEYNNLPRLSHPFKFPHLPQDFDMLHWWRKLKDFASLKIGKVRDLGESENQGEINEQQLEIVAAIISMTTGTGLYHSSLVTSLVERRMAFLLDYRYGKGQLLVTYPVEPVLSFAALRLFKSFALKIIKQLISSHIFSPENVGEIGELVVRILLLLCLPNPEKDLRPCYSAKAFLRNILGVKGLKTLEKIGNADAKDILGGTICMSFFTKVFKASKNPKRNIGSGIMYNAGLILPNGFPGLDLVIPVVLKNGKLSSINIQAKSYAERLPESVVTDSLVRLSSSLFCSADIPSLNMLINVTPCREVDVVNIFEDKGKVVIHIEGLFSKAFPFIESKYGDLREYLQIFLEFGRLERTFKGDKLSRTVNTPYIDSVFDHLRKNPKKCANDPDWDLFFEYKNAEKIVYDSYSDSETETADDVHSGSETETADVHSDVEMEAKSAEEVTNDVNLERVKRLRVDESQS